MRRVAVPCTLCAVWKDCTIKRVVTDSGERLFVDAAGRLKDCRAGSKTGKGARSIAGDSGLRGTELPTLESWKAVRGTSAKAKRSFTACVVKPRMDCKPFR
jgi:hypothetical protein